MIDTHCHIHSSEFDAIREDIVFSLKSHDIQAIIVGTDIEDSKKAVDLSRKYDFLHSSVGVHPHEYDTYSDMYTLSESLTQIIETQEVTAIGECGFDFYYHTADEVRDKQEQLFCIQIDLALKYNKPLIIHTRDSFEETYQVLSRYKDLTIILHCFTGTIDWVQKFNTLSHRIYYSFSGIITFNKTESIQESVAFIPEDYILVETDSPYLAPVPYRGKQNTPLFIEYTIEKIASIRNINKKDMINILDKNAKIAFNL